MASERLSGVAQFPSKSSSTISLLLSKNLIGVAEKPMIAASLFVSMIFFTALPQVSAPALCNSSNNIKSTFISFNLPLLSIAASLL